MGQAASPASKSLEVSQSSIVEDSSLETVREEGQQNISSCGAYYKTHILSCCPSKIPGLHANFPCLHSEKQSSEPGQAGQGISPVEKASPRGLNVLCYIIFLGTFEWGIVIPTLFPLLKRMNGEEIHFGIMIGTFSVTRMLCQPLIGALGDRLDFKALLCSCLGLSVVGGALYALADSPWLLFTARVICGLGASSTPLLFAWTARALKGIEEVGAAQVRLNTVRSLGILIGPFSSTILFLLPEQGFFNQLNSSGWVICIVNLVGIILCRRFVDHVALPEENKLSDIENEKNNHSSVSIWKTPAIWICLSFQVITALLLAILEVLPPLVLDKEFQIQPWGTSVVFGGASFIVLGLFTGTAFFGHHWSRRSIISVGVGATTAGGIWAFTSWLDGLSFIEFVLPWLILIAVPPVLIRTPARVLYTSHVPQRMQGWMQGISEGLFSFANFLGPILGSHLVGKDGLSGIRYWMLVMVLLEFCLVAFGFPGLKPGMELHQ